MKTFLLSAFTLFRLSVCFLVGMLVSVTLSAESWVRINQVGIFLWSYGTNEPVIDGTCYLIYHLSLMEQRGKEQAKALLNK